MPETCPRHNRVEWSKHCLGNVPGMSQAHMETKPGLTVPYMYLIFLALVDYKIYWANLIYRNFKDTNKINFMMAMMFVSDVSVLELRV